MEAKYYVYIHKDRKTGSVVYVGKGSNFRYSDHNSRQDEHLTMMKKGKLDYIILKYFDDELNAYDYEEKITEAYKSFNQCRFNISIGRRTSESTKEKLSKVLRGKRRREETKERIRNNHARPSAKPVLMFKDGAMVKKFRSSREAAIYASGNGICSYGWCGRSLTTGEETKSTRSFPIGGYRFVYDDDKIQYKKDQ